MCFWNMCFFCADCRKRKYVVRKPDGMQEAPDKILCLACGHTGRGVYVTEANGCSVCFIPCPCSCNRGDTSLACGRCRTTFANMNLDRCPDCGVYSSVAAKHCGNCGKRLQPSNGNNGNTANTEGSTGGNSGDNGPDEKKGKTVKEMHNNQ
ncbi:hypothetical protein PAEPH01_0970 [Pancytospora epiphaga]|nr:hypothetical protein PAEPH01_0970 [Pancytospora epiphaga]